MWLFIDRSALGSDYAALRPALLLSPFIHILSTHPLLPDPDFHPPPTLPCQFTLIFPPPRPLPLPRHSLHCSENPAILSVAFIYCILICGSDANVLALFLLKAFQSLFDALKYLFAIFILCFIPPKYN